MNKEKRGTNSDASSLNINNGEGTWNQYGDNVSGNKYISNYYVSDLKQTDLENRERKIDLQTIYDIEDRIDKVKKMSVFPWFRKTLKYCEAYPKLFIFPCMQEGKTTISFEQLENYKEENLAIIGEAGAGKTTLLRFFFAFCDHDGYYCFYFPADEIKSRRELFDQLLCVAQQSDKKFLFCIDGIDEAYFENIQGYFELITKIRASRNCAFWLGCRADYYSHYAGERTAYSERTFRILPWNKEQSDGFIREYSKIVGDPELSGKIDKLLGMDSNIAQLKTNPFQLALLAFLAEGDECGPLRGIYDLYEKFMREWLKHEIGHGRCRDDGYTILVSLRKIARQIYDGEEYQFDDIANHNTAIGELLIVDNTDITGNRVAHRFYHRSLAAFLLANSVIEAMLSGDTERLRAVLPYKLKDDVTNFIGNKFTTLTYSEKERIKDTIQRTYLSTKKSDDNLIVREQSIYFLTRLGIDVSEFLEKVIASDSQNRIMRLTLAYGAVLSESGILRRYALDYAKSIYAETEDAVTNRAWTVVYFGDVLTEGPEERIVSPYTYLDTVKGSWKNARKARIKRFTREAPGLKDYRFRLFGIPLFYSFLKDRGWDDISETELKILETVSFPQEYFSTEEISFLESVREELVTTYRKKLALLNL